MLDNTIESYSKLGLDTLAPTKKKVNLKNILPSTLKVLALSTTKKVNFDFSIKENLLINSNKYKSLMIPLICVVENAFEAIPDNGIIRVSVARNTNSMKIKIHNNGPSIKEPRGEIYKRGFSTKGRDGLGLTIAKETIEEILNGKLTYKNEPTGGVTFIIELKRG